MLSVATDKFRVGVPKDEPKDKELELFQAVTGGCPLQSIKPLIKARCEQLDAWMMMQADEQDWPIVFNGNDTAIWDIQFRECLKVINWQG